MSRTPQFFLSAIFTLGLLAEARADEPGSLQQPMRLGPAITLPFVPGRVLFHPGNKVFFTASENDGIRETATISAYNAEDALRISQIYVLHTVDAMAFSDDGSWLFLVGGSNGNGYATRVRASDVLESAPPPAVTTIKLAKVPVQPSVAVGRETLYVSDATSERLIAIPWSVFDRAAASENFDAANLESQLFSWGRGVHALTVSKAVNLAFVSYETLPKISALRIVSPNYNTQQVDSFSRSSTKGNIYGDRPVPLSLLMTTGIKAQDGRATASLLVGDHTSLMLTLVDFDPLFRTMDVVATAPIGIRIDPKANVQADPITGLVKQPMLLGSDDNQSTILVGDLYSSQLVQFTRGTRDVTLERVGEIEISGVPSSISVSSDGGAAVVAVANSHDLRILAPANPTANAPDTDIRQLQRELAALGLNVGGIDGVVGQGTITALNIFNSATGSNVSVKDVDGALKAVEDFRRKCDTSGLRCLVNSQVK